MMRIGFDNYSEKFNFYLQLKIRRNLQHTRAPTKEELPFFFTNQKQTLTQKQANQEQQCLKQNGTKNLSIQAHLLMPVAFLTASVAPWALAFICSPAYKNKQNILKTLPPMQNNA